MTITKPLFDNAYLNNPAPEYPAHARRRNMEGTVMLDVMVSAEGIAHYVRIAESSGFSLLDESAKNAVSRWKFVPARRGSDIVEARVIVPIEFRLD
jgi:protein TonB